MTITASQTNEVDEAEIIRRVVGGDRDQFRILVERYQDMVFAMVLRQVRERAAAQDIAQECFIRAFQYLRQFRFDAKFSTWLTRITLNQLSNYFSSKSYRRQRNTESITAEHEMSSVTDPHKQRELLCNLHAGIAALEPALQRVMILCGVEQRSYEEAAEVLEIPIGTVRSQLNRARLKLRVIMKEMETGTHS